MTTFTHIHHLVCTAVAFESTVMKSILYVAIFVICLFLLAGVFKQSSIHGKTGNAVEEFLGFLKNGDFISLKEKYPVFIKFEDSQKLTPQERVEDIRQQQLANFEEVIAQYDFRNIAEVRIEKVNKRAFQYELSTDATVTGQLVYKNGFTKHFRANLNQDRMLSLSVDDICILNDKCPKL